MTFASVSQFHEVGADCKTLRNLREGSFAALVSSVLGIQSVGGGLCPLGVASSVITTIISNKYSLQCLTPHTTSGDLHHTANTTPPTQHQTFMPLTQPDKIRSKGRHFILLHIIF